MMVSDKFSLKSVFVVSTALLLFCIITWEGHASRIFEAEIYSTLTTDTIPAPRKITTVPADTLTNPTGVPKSPAAPARITESRTDTVPAPADTSIKLTGRDSLIARNDTFDLKLSKDTLDAPVHYEAEDSAVVLVAEKKIILYGKTKTNYQDITLTAPKVELDQRTNVLTAVNEKDSLGDVITRAKFEQGENKFESDTIQFNFKTQRGYTKNTFTQDGEMFVQGETIKKVNSSTFFVKSGRFTTCNLDEPHFAFRANKMKVINNKVAVTGPVHPEFEGVPVPVYLPFGFYPLNRGRHSGLLAPQFTVNEEFGLGLEGLGYYHVLNDNIDVTLRSNIYSYGGWSANVTPSYRRRYRYSGAFNLSLQHTKQNFKGDPDYNKTKTFFVSWNHTVDQKARPGTNFSANVNAGSTKHNRLIPNDPRRNFQNQLSSSITYSKTWVGKPYNLTLSANHDQNNAIRLVNLRLPDAGFSVTTVYPFQRKEAIGSKKWYENLGLGYNGSFKNQFSFYDSAVNFNRLLDTLQWGANHNIPIQLALPALGPLIVSPGISYQEQWIMRKVSLAYDPTTKKIDTSFSKGFFTARQVTTNLSFNTAVYGTMNFKDSRLQALRHVLRPNFGIAYTPNMAGSYWKKVQDSTGRIIEYSQFSGNLFTGGFNNREFGGITFGLDNTLEMKLRSRKDTGEAAIKKVRLIDALNISSGYNFLEDSFQLSDFNVGFRSTLFDKLNLNANANLSPYQVDSFGQRINRYTWKDGFKPGRVTNMYISLSTQFRSKPRDGAKQPTEETLQKGKQISDPALLADQQRLQDYMQRNPSEFVNFDIPWDIGLDFSLNLTRQLKRDLSGFENIINSNLMFRSSFSLTPKWNFSTNGYFDVNTTKLQQFTMSINREMHCWQLSVNVTPVGPYSYFNISISPRSGMLQDLRVNRTRVFQNF